MDTKTLLQIIADYAAKTPDRLCVADTEHEYTYREFWQSVTRVSEALSRQGVKRQDAVMVQCTQDGRYLITALAVQLAGAYFVPLEMTCALDRAKDIQEETGAPLLITRDFLDFSLGDCKAVSFDDIWAAAANEPEIMFPDPDATAEILYTTGTTGKSKGIEITHKNNMAIVENIAFGTEMKEGNIELIPLPLSHSHALRCCYTNLFRNGTIILADGVTRVKLIYDLIEKYHVTAMDISPAAATVLIKLTKGKIGDFNGSLDYIQIGTAVLQEDLKEQLLQIFPDVRLYNFYGSTESGRSCVLNFNSPDNRKFCIGRPTKNAKFIVTDSERNEIQSSPEDTGLLACAGAMNMKCYYKQPELTASVLQNGYLFTNDEGYIDDEGRVYVLGRADDIINYQGIKIAPEEIEEVAKQCEGVSDCACVPIVDKIAGQAPKLFYVAEHPADFDEDVLMKYMEVHIDGNKLPKRYERIDEIPRTYNGKILRRKLIAE